MTMTNAVEEFLDDLRGGKMTESPVVRVEQGELQGRLINSTSGKAFYTFLGIPYAKPPIGSLRFRGPQPPEPWEGVRDATSEGNSSAQIDHLQAKYIGDENCLYLNVYTPNIDGEFLPVMVFIHGGGFQFGTGSPSLYGGEFLVEKDVVLVTLNYRCGPLGFLSLNTPEVPGNAGLKDMAQALRWVKENIQNFGGNSGNLTIFGESAGGASVALLTASPLTRDWISKAIIQSGTSLNSWVMQRNPVENAKALAKELGCESNNVDEIFEFLLTTPVKDIVEASEKISRLMSKFSEEGKILFGPVVEKEFAGVESFLTEPFTDLLTSGRTAAIPIMIGNCTLEFTFDRGGEDLQVYIPEELNIERNSPESIEIAQEIEKLYFKGTPSSVASMRERFELVSDVLINIGTHRYVKYLIMATNKPVYYYKFDYIGEMNMSKKTKSLGMEHSGHADELNYLFNNEAFKDVEPTPQDIKIRERLVRLWTNFAKSGNPTPDENHYITVTWLPVNRDNIYYLRLSNELSLETNPDQDKMNFWESVYEKHYKIWQDDKPNEIIPISPNVETEEDVPQIVEDTIPTINQRDNEVEEPVEAEKELVDVVDNSETPNVQENNVHEQDETDVNIVNVKEKIEQHEHNNVMTTNGELKLNGNSERKPRPSNEIKMVQPNNANPKDVIRANDPPEDDLPKNIGVNKFVNFFESLGGKK